MQQTDEVSGRASGEGFPPEDPDARMFLDLLRHRDVRAVFQPIVDLATGQLTGLEALARGPEGSPYASPFALFTAAAACGRTAELDWVCRATAFRQALAAKLPGSLSLFVNIEAESLATPCPPDLSDVVAAAETSLRVFVELNDRALAADPAGLLAAVDRARQMRWGVAVDDVGASLGCLAVLPMVHADVVKLDLRLLGQDMSRAGRMVFCVMRHLEFTGASMVAEGIETEEDLTGARALGATHGQGHLLGLPGPLADHYPMVRSVVPVVGRAVDDVPSRSPFRALDGVPTRRLDASLVTMSMQFVAEQVHATAGRPVVLASLGPYGEILVEQLAVLQSMAESAVLIVLFGVAVPAEPAPGVQGVSLDIGDPLATDWFVVALTEQSATLQLARVPHGAPHLFDMVMTQRPELVNAVARQLVRRIPPRGATHHALPAPPAQESEVLHMPDDAPTAPVPQHSRWTSRLRRHD